MPADLSVFRPLPAPLRHLAVPAWATDPRTTMIVVSGYPPLVGTAFFCGTRQVVAGTALDPAALAPPLPPRARCHRCRAWDDPTRLLDERLGWPWWCPKCVGIGVRRCLQRHGRLPAHHEFWCPQCGHIRNQAGDSCPREADGRKRHLCLACRRAQWKRRAGGH
jgi:hypothetical protein